MAIMFNVETTFGEVRGLYIRLNSIEVNNHGQQSFALFRGFISKAAFDAGKACVWELTVSFDAVVSNPLWPQAYDALRVEIGAENVPEV